jgi:hypothetical protein
MGETWIQQENRSKKMENSRTGLNDAPFECVIKTVSPESDTMTLQGPFGMRNFNVLHPYQGNSSWVRSMPDNSLVALVQIRADTKVQEVVGYRNSNSSRRAQRYKADDTEQGSIIGSLASKAASALSSALGLSSDTEPAEPAANKFEAYRPLFSGEHDVGSAGLSQIFWGNRAVLDSRAGVIKHGMSQDRMESYEKAPVHRRMLHFHAANKLYDEERLGVIFRSTDDSYYKKTWCKYKNKFAREHMIHLLDGERKPLFWERSGHVFDETGEIEQCEDTGKPLRVKKIYYTVGGALASVLGEREEAVFQLDEEGNLVVDLPEGATTGFIFRTPKGTHQIEIGVDYNITVDNNWIETVSGGKTEVVSGDVEQTYDSSWILKVAEKWDADINGAKILIDGASIHIEDTSGNKIDTNDAGVKVVDLSANTVEMTSDGITITDTNKNVAEMTSDGIKAKDKNNNIVDMTSSSVKVTAVSKAIIESPAIELGDGATEAVIKGTAFKTWLTMHTHPTAVGPSGPPVQAATFDVPPGSHLSLITKTK